MGEPRYPDDYLPLADAARPLLPGIIRELHAMGVEPDEAVWVVHAEDCPCCAAHTDRYIAPGVRVGVAPRHLAIGAPKTTDACYLALLRRPAPGKVLCLVGIQRGDAHYLAPLEVEVPRG